ncbi:MAG: alkaline phosphatase [Chloroflexi bacterium]|nr:alkaline phosphatase [Chloroflexota bacterium]
MRNGRFARLMTGILVAVIALSMFLPGVSVEAQGDAPPVLILPIDNADFLPGALFDFRVEVHADALPDDFAVTVNGVAPADFFSVEGTEESWEFGSEDAPTPAQSVIWRGVNLPAAGDYTVEVTAGGETHTAVWAAREPQAGTAKNVILFIADGGNLPFFTATRLVSRGMVDGYYNDRLSWETFEEIGHLSTSGIDSIITDSANSASAFNTGHKTATNATGVYPDTSPDTLDDPRTETFAELVKRTRGMSVGIVTTADWSDATPAAVFGHGRDRSAGNRAAYVAQVLDGGWLPEVIMGGGAGYMLPNTADGSRRSDDRDMYTEYEAAGYTVATNATEMNDALAAGVERLIGIFRPGDMNVWLDRNVYTDNLGDFTDQPGLVDMTIAALSILSTNENGFYLEVEAASVDKQLHPLDFDRALADAIEFDRAIAAAAEWAAANSPDTLIVVTADHAHGFDVWGTVDVEEFNAAQDDIARRDAIGIYNNAGFPTYVDEDGDFYPDNWNPSVTLAMGVNNIPGFTENYQVSEVPRVPAVTTDDGLGVDNPEDDPNGITLNSNLPPSSTNGGHTMQDVPVYATGPGSAYFGRAQENVEVFFGMAAAIGLDPLAEGGMAATVNTDAAPAAKAETGTAGVGGLDFATILLVIAAFAAGFVVRRNRAEA